MPPRIPQDQWSGVETAGGADPDRSANARRESSSPLRIRLPSAPNRLFLLRGASDRDARGHMRQSPPSLVTDLLQDARQLDTE